MVEGDRQVACDYCGLTPADVGQLVQGNADPRDPALICWGCAVQVQELLLCERLRNSQRSSGRDRHAIILSHAALTTG